MNLIFWSNGETYQKYTRNDKPLSNSINNVAYVGNYNIKKNDKINEKKTGEIMNRQMLSQTFQNPFLHKSYNDVLADQEKYLKPQNSLINEEPLSLE